MIESESEARTVADDYLRETLAPEIGVQLQITTVQEFATSWVVGYNSQAYLETGLTRHALVGGGLLIVNRRTGGVRRGTWNDTVESQLDST